jgi:hypothetical protein
MPEPECNRFNQDPPPESQGDVIQTLANKGISQVIEIVNVLVRALRLM